MRKILVWDEMDLCMQLSSTMFETEFLVVAVAQQQSANWTESPLKNTWLALQPLTVMKPKRDTWVSGLEGVEGGRGWKSLQQEGEDSL